MVGISKEKNDYHKLFNDCYLSIMKDEIDRKVKGTGKLREKPWSNFLFYFIDREKYQQLFGTMETHRSVDKIDLDGNIIFTPYINSKNVKNLKAPYMNATNNFKIAQYLFNDIKNNKSFLFVRSYVYITIVLYDNNEISTANFLTYYFNTNYKFSETNRKKGFISNVKFSYLVEDIEQ